MRQLLRCAAFGGLLFGAGCVTTAGGHLEDLLPERTESSDRSDRAARATVAPEVEQTVGDFAFHLDGGKFVTSNKMGRELNDEILNRWREAGLISGHRYVPNSAFSSDAAWRVKLEGRQDGESPLWLQVLSGLTLYAIPHYVDTRLALTYALENAATGCRFRASVEDSYTTVIGLVFLPATPFAQRGRDVTFARIADHLYEQLAKQGAFDPATGCQTH